MHAVIVEVNTSGADRDRAIEILRNEVVPRIKQLPGFQSGTWLYPNEESKGFALLLFDTEENARGAQSMIPVGGEPQPGVTVERSELREVSITA